MPCIKDFFSKQYLQKIYPINRKYFTELTMNLIQKRYCDIDNGETSWEDCMYRICKTFGSNKAHGERLYKYLSLGWFVPSTPIIANGGLEKKGIPISCYINEAYDNNNDYLQTFVDNCNISLSCGGIGSYLGDMPIKDIIPFCKMIETGNWMFSSKVRKSGAAVYLPIDHGGIESFLEMRRPVGSGDHRLKCLEIHHGIIISDAFFKALSNFEDWKLFDSNKKFYKSIPAFELWQKILKARMETGEPYILFKENMENNSSDMYKKLNILPKTSNLCSEITLATGLDHLNNKRTAVCCLSALNIFFFKEWSKDETFIYDVMEFLDNVLTESEILLKNTIPSAAYSIRRERSIGIGAMGFHSFLQKNNIAIDSLEATRQNENIFSHIKHYVDKSNKKLGELRGPCLDGVDSNILNRHTNTMAIAPNASTGYLAGMSPGIEMNSSNYQTIKGSLGNYNIKNMVLVDLLKNKHEDNETTWNNIKLHNGSVKNLSFLSDQEKKIFATAIEVDQSVIIDLAGDRQKYIDQSQSVNLFINDNIDFMDLHKLHIRAYKKGLKSLYYLRSVISHKTESVYFSTHKKDISINNDKSSFQSHKSKIIPSNVVNDQMLDNNVCIECCI